MVPDKDELINFIRRRDIVNLSAIAKNFNIQNATVSDLINDLQKKKLIVVKKIGGSKIVRVR